MLTDILYLINSNLKFNPVVKDRLYYDLYQYSIGFHLDEASCLRELNHQYIDSVIERRREWREISQQRWNKVNWSSGRNAVGKRTREITAETVKNLHDFTDILLRSRVEFKLITSVSNAWVYTNDAKLLEDLNRVDFLIDKKFTQVVVNRPRNTIQLKTPLHQHRGYFKSTKLSDQEKTQLDNFFCNQTENIRVSPAMREWFGSRFHRTQDYFFIDYNEESWIVMLSLIKPGLIRKTVDLIAR